MHLSNTLTFLTSLAVTLVSASHHASNRNHAAMSVDKRSETGISLFKRIDNARLSYYADGLGACGKTNKPSDFIVALNSAQFAGGAHCFEMITINYQGKSTQAQIMDECPGCPYGGLDCSEGLFNYFSSESAGIIYGSWSFANAVTVPSWIPTPKASPKAKETPSSTYSPPPPSSTKAKPSAKAKLSSSSQAPTTTASSSSSSSSSTSSATPSSMSPTNKAVATAGAIESKQAAQSNLYAFNMAFMGLSGLVTDALSSK